MGKNRSSIGGTALTAFHMLCHIILPFEHVSGPGSSFENRGHTGDTEKKIFTAVNWLPAMTQCYLGVACALCTAF